MASAIEKKPNLWSTEALSFSGTRQAKLAQGLPDSSHACLVVLFRILDPLKTQLIKIS